MSRIFFAIALICALAASAFAHDFSALARIEPANSHVQNDGQAGVQVQLGLSQGVPYRVFTLENPYRVVLDFKEVDWTGLESDSFLQADRVTSVQFGAYVPGWSRMVLELGAPMVVDTAGLRIDSASGAAELSLRLKRSTAETFAASAGAPRQPGWDLPEAADLPDAHPSDGPRPLRVMLDPGHGGIDPGAEVQGVNEKSLMLTFARELRELLLRQDGYEVILTRTDDHFVSLERRIALAHRAGADVFISLHADILSEGRAHGAAVYTLSQDASDVASHKLAERHDRADLISGIDLSGADDQVADVLLDLARQETRPRTDALAGALANGMAQQGGPMNSHPIRTASFSVLKAADIPSVLIELGFLSSPRDLKNIVDPEWRMGMARGIRDGLEDWRQQDVIRRSLIGQ
ncbi:MULTISPECIES: N-acetylmuramoyl-L-alanine amidase [unclassified Ruegeria]|uniref:N-acetylmuramoyl-L-alanine amidase n=1 Tax=unclassified Ruegeria TaxID=2625375 RepID=UPI001AD98D2F|nr:MULTISPECIES: N-acetylmuramoyl-L-alanine amidase [unclassified Ruegeria]MBO9410432.1 N-acetylmuramoyl-L-alanine amidase [Ruegeria sp. R8_1]MBO9414349.1 N-acetylmuramoyl-L-alanine amidase [Ruegeria sp. R8_2]